jgi:hypothetical protein
VARPIAFLAVEPANDEKLKERVIKGLFVQVQASPHPKISPGKRQTAFGEKGWPTRHT